MLIKNVGYTVGILFLSSDALWREQAKNKSRIFSISSEFI